MNKYNGYTKELKGWGFDIDGLRGRGRLSLSTEGATRKFSNLPTTKQLVKEINKQRTCQYSGLLSTEEYM